jgi:hypothetical protein
MHLSSAFDGRRLCENTVGLLEEEEGRSSWTAAGAADKTEWINMVRTVTTIGSDFYVQESLHPNYLGPDTGAAATPGHAALRLRSGT